MATLTKNLTISSQGVYALEMNIIPNGSTVTPVNDIQTWLHCGDIWNKNYTTLTQVLNDPSTLNSLIQSNNAADYMVRSTEWASNPGLVPKMTSNTTPSGTASSSGVYSDYQPWKAFDQNPAASDHWANSSSASSGAWISYYHAGNSVVVRRVYLQNANNSPTPRPIKKFRLQGSNDGTNWTNIGDEKTNTSEAVAAGAYYDFNNSIAYKYHRILATELYAQCQSGSTWYTAIGILQFYTNATSVTENQTAMTYIGANNYCAGKLIENSIWRTAICNSTYSSNVLTSKVPTMTSNTAPSGQVIYSDYLIMDAGGGYPYQAFDNNNQTVWHGSADSYTNKYVGYKFTQAVKVAKIEFSSFVYYDVSRVKQYKVQRSNDNSTWIDITEVLTCPNTKTSTSIGGIDGYRVGTKNTIIASKNVGASQYYRIFVIDAYSSTQIPAIVDAQFYGHV